MMKENGVASDETDEFTGLDATHVIVVSLLLNAFISSVIAVDNVDSFCTLASYGLLSSH